MKLELENIIPYLPYGLKAVKGVTRIEITSISLELPHIYHTSYLGSRIRVVSKIEEIKPILRPLSDLTKEIYHNGETFISLDELTEGETVGMSLNDYAEDWDNRTFYSFERYVNEWIKGDNHNLDFLPFGFIQKLFEWHFDIYGLIEQGLAIDINTIEND